MFAGHNAPSLQGGRLGWVGFPMPTVAERSPKTEGWEVTEGNLGFPLYVTGEPERSEGVFSKT